MTMKKHTFTLAVTLALATLSLLASGCASNSSIPAPVHAPTAKNSTNQTANTPFYIGDWRYTHAVFDDMDMENFCKAKQYKRGRESCYRKMHDLTTTIFRIEPEQMTAIVNGKKQETIAVTFTDIAPYHVRLNPKKDTPFELKKQGEQLCMVKPLKKLRPKVKNIEVCLMRVK